MLGEYIREGGGVGRPYYRQRDTAGKKDNFLYFFGQRWRVSKVLGDDSGFLRSSLDTGDSVGPPQSGWEYLGLGLNWQEEDTSLVLERGALEPCERVVVAAIGQLARTRRKELGTFVPTGNWIKGRPVYGNKDGSPRYLRMAEGRPGWGISPSPNLTGSFTLASGRGTVSPGSLEAGPSVRQGWKGWQWKDSRGGWREANGRLIVACHTSNNGIKPGSRVLQEFIYIVLIPADCEVSSWSPWGICSASCGGGSRDRSRQITRQPQGAGDKCPHLTDFEKCITRSCPGKKLFQVEVPKKLFALIFKLYEYLPYMFSDTAQRLVIVIIGRTLQQKLNSSSHIMYFH